MNAAEVWTFVVGALKFLVAPAIVSTLVTLAVTYFKERQTKALDLSQSAWEVCQTLERYAIACSRLVEDVRYSQGLYNAGQVEFASDCGGLPIFEFPEAINWRAFKGPDSYQIREFETAYSATKRYIDLPHEDDEQLPGSLEILRVEAAKLGLDAWRLAKEVRTKHSLPVAELHPHDGKTIATLTDEVEQFDNREKQRIAEWKRQFESMSALTTPKPPSLQSAT